MKCHAARFGIFLASDNCVPGSRTKAHARGTAQAAFRIKPEGIARGNAFFGGVHRDEW
jgi:hypothetical protein